VDKKRGDNPVKEILGKNYWEVGVPVRTPPSLSVPPPIKRGFLFKYTTYEE
jgi:hypothetical protein